jgi:hypothetical protein
MAFLRLAVLLALLSLHSATSFSNPADPIPRIKRQAPVPSFPLSGHYRRPRQTAVAVVSIPTADDVVSFPPVDDCESNNSSRVTASSVTSFFRSCYTRYLENCERRPFLTNSITTCVLAGVGDILAQSLQVSNAVTGISSFNWIRWRTFMLTGLLFEGPWVSFWYQGLSNLGLWMERKFKSGPRQQVLGKVLADQTIGVVIYYPVFFVVYECIGAILSGQGTNEYVLVYIPFDQGAKRETNYLV